MNEYYFNVSIYFSNLTFLNLRITHKNIRNSILLVYMLNYKEITHLNNKDS